MLKGLKVKNFKSLENFEVEFEKFNVLVGRNNSGKSNVIDCLKFLSEGFRDPIEKIFIRRGGYKEVVFGGNEENDVEIGVEFELNFEKEKFLFEYHVKISGKRDVREIIEEKVEITDGKYKMVEIPNLGWFGKIVYGNIPSIVRQSIPIYSYDPDKPRNNKELLIGKLLRKETVGMALLSAFQNIYTYKIIPQNIKTESSSVFVDKYLLLDEGCENLALFLLKLSQQDKKRFERTKELLSGVVDDIEDISPTVEGKHVYLKVKDKNFDKYFYPESISDGTISLLSYITIIETIKENTIVCFEEPENYIHMRLLEFLVDLMKNSGSQVILATHSPYFIDRCEPDELIIIEKENGKTTARKIDPERIKKEIGEYGGTLGEMYYSDEFKKEKGE